MFNPDTAPYYDGYLRSFRASPQRPSVKADAVYVRSVAEIDLAVAELGREPGSGLIAAPDPYIITVRGAILKAADRHRVPVISAYRQFVEEGSLMSYGPDTTEIFRRSAPPISIAFSTASRLAICRRNRRTNFELFVNLRTAKALGLSVRESFLLLADAVIE